MLLFGIILAVYCDEVPTCWEVEVPIEVNVEALEVGEVDTEELIIVVEVEIVEFGFEEVEEVDNTADVPNWGVVVIGWLVLVVKVEEFDLEEDVEGGFVVEDDVVGENVIMEAVV